MKIRNLIIMLIALFSVLTVNNAFGQSVQAGQPKAKKPRLVVVPSNALLSQMGLLQTTDDMGSESYIPQYKQAFLDTDLKGCIAKIAEMFNDKGFPITMLETELNRVQGKNLVIPVDIRLELNYKINKVGPRDKLYFELTGIDNFSSKQIAGTSGESKPAIGETTVNLLQEAVLSQIDKFANDLQTTFENMAVNGRESRLTVTATNDVSLDDDIDGGSISDFVENWLNKNCVNASFSIDSQDNLSMQVSQSMMPLFTPEGKALDAYNFYKSLAQDLQSACASKGYVVKNIRDAKKSNSLGGTLGDGNIEISK